MRYLLVAILLLLPALGTAQDHHPRLTRTFQWENDEPLSDEHYTNGLRFSTSMTAPPLWRHRARHHWLWKRLVLGLSPCSANVPDDCFEMSTGIRFGQHFYTPANLVTRSPQPADRPYAAMLYVGRTFGFARGPWRQELEYDVGMVGPLALGESVQKGWHSLWNGVRPNGWDHQVPMGPAVQATSRTHFQLLEGAIFPRPGIRAGSASDGPHHFDLVPRVEVMAGTPMTLGRIGATIRVGLNVPGDLLTPTIPGPPPTGESSAGSNPDPLDNWNAEETTGPVTDEQRELWELQAVRMRQIAERPGHRPPPVYLFVSGDLTGVVHNAFIEGTPLRDDNPAAPELERGYAQWELGFVSRLPILRADLTLRRVVRTAEFQGADTHAYTALSLSW